MGVAATPLVRILVALMPCVGKVTIQGAENLSGAEGKIVVCNHVGWADPMWLGYAVFPYKLHQMAKKELFRNPIIAWLIKQCGAFPIERSSPSAATIKQVISLVEQGNLVLIFPSGTRSNDAIAAKRGAATIALHAKAQLVPAHYQGPCTMSWRHLLRRPSIHITFGEPIILPDDALADKTSALQLTARLNQAMAELVS